EVIKNLAAHKHQYAHIKLKSGKVLTGSLSDIGDQGFYLSTDALAGSYILYRDIAETPRSTPAVGTRIKQGAQWTGLIAITILAIPILLPLALTGLLPDC